MIGDRHYGKVTPESAAEILCQERQGN